MDFAAKMISAREEKGWGPNEAARQTGLSRGILRTLEGRNAKRAPSPEKVEVGTAFRIIKTYWPSFQPADFGLDDSMVCCLNDDGVVTLP